jgi:hypothetical protein
MKLAETYTKWVVINNLQSRLEVAFKVVDKSGAWISSRLTGRRGSVSKKGVLSFSPHQPEPAFLLVTIL